MSRAALCLLMVLVPQVLAAQGAPLFEPRPEAFPHPHLYTGGWEHFVGGGVAVMDCNGDSLPDIVAAGGESPARLFLNTTPEPGAPILFASGDFPDLRGVTGAYPLDVDGDGILDLAILRVGANMLLRGDGACGFVDASQDWGFDGGDRWTTAFSATWESGQSRPTMAFGNYVNRDDPEGPFGACDDHALYRPEGNNYGAPLTLSPGYCALSMLISDWRRDGVPELRISNDRHYYLRGGYEEMWRLSPLVPRTEADGWDKVSLWGMGIASADLTGDGFPEVMLTSMGDQLLQFNDAGQMRNAAFAVGAAAQRPYQGDDGRPSTGWHAEFGDVDNDGLLDLFIAKGNVDQMPSNAMRDPNNLLMQQADGTFVEHGGAAGIGDEARSRGAALADFDGDGRLDLVVNARRAPLTLWQNITANTGHWLAISPRMEGANRFGLGAWIELRGAGALQSREVTSGGGHAGGQAGPAHFGLGAAKSAEVRVIWPDGTAGGWARYDADQRIVIRP